MFFLTKNLGHLVTGISSGQFQELLQDMQGPTSHP